jgi:hypothetical protein
MSNKNSLITDINATFQMARIQMVTFQMARIQMARMQTLAQILGPLDMRLYYWQHLRTHSSKIIRYKLKILNALTTIGWEELQNLGLGFDRARTAEHSS